MPTRVAPDCSQSLVSQCYYLHGPPHGPLLRREQTVEDHIVQGLLHRDRQFIGHHTFRDGGVQQLFLLGPLPVGFGRRCPAAH